ncbi:MAG: HRDC domain-containing protein [Magnetococcales bacterium]|nr:HRDC domain-containing protein [Magnetococcales bacterium]
MESKGEALGCDIFFGRYFVNVRVFTLKLNVLTGSFDDSEVRAFTSDKDVHSIRDHAFVHQGVPHLALVVTYHAASGSESSEPTGKNHANERDESWRKVLKDADMPMFNTLREWRAKKSREEGIPPSFGCTNKQLADVVRLRPGNVTALAKMDGFGEGRLKKYGQEILTVLGKSVGTNIPQEDEGIVPIHKLTLTTRNIHYTRNTVC